MSGYVACYRHVWETIPTSTLHSTVGTGVGLAAPSRSPTRAGPAPAAASGVSVPATAETFLLTGSSPAILARAWVTEAKVSGTWGDTTEGSGIWTEIIEHSGDWTKQ